MPKAPQVIRIKPRRCKYCRVIFSPVCRNEQQRTNAEAQKFCIPAHRKAYHLSGGINFDQLVEKAAAKVREVLATDEKFIAIVAKTVSQLKASNEMQEALARIQLEGLRPRHPARSAPSTE